ncbi:HNH endonuclease [Deinococcus hohokamensis]|uniref:HNH endonuclease n=1 Tax=Deinococcus hohokamensis TaxID=309883 RepID=A0ABV9I5Q4_9DEIO
MRLTEASLCGYCGEPATEIEHVIARQFFPAADHERKKNIPRIPACRACNAAKQKSEDTMGVFLTVSSSDESAKKVMEERIGRTLRKNQRIRRLIRDNLVATESGVGFGVPLDEQGEEIDFWDWLVRGLYYYELQTPMRVDEDLHIALVDVKGPLERSRPLMPVRRNVQYRTYAGKDMQTYFSVDGDRQCWLIEFRNRKILVTNVIEAGSQLEQDLHEMPRYRLSR